MINLSDRQDIIGYLSWCEATDTKPFGEDEEQEEENTEDENNEITINKTKSLRKGRMIKYE